MMISIYFSSNAGANLCHSRRLGPQKQENLSCSGVKSGIFCLACNWNNYFLNIY